MGFSHFKCRVAMGDQKNWVNVAREKALGQGGKPQAHVKKRRS